jgi:hypothetical protein
MTGTPVDSAIRHPVGLLVSAEPPEHFREHRPCQRDPVFIEQNIYSTLFARARF